MEGSLVPQEQPHIVHRMFSHRVLITIILSIIIAISAYLFLLYWSETPPRDYTFQVEKTDTVHTIAQKLVSTGIIKHRLFFYASYYLFGLDETIEPGGYKLSSTMKTREMVHILESKPVSKFVRIPPNVNKENIAKIIADTLEWDALDRQYFSHTYAGMQWQHYQDYIKDFFQKKYSWNDKKTITFLTLSSLYYDDKYDFFRNMYVPGTYEIPINASRAQVAGILIDQFVKDNIDDQKALEKYIDEQSSKNAVSLIEEEMILMPDLVSIPPQDLTLRRVGDKTNLLFTGAYWNKGRGPLEIVADPKTKGITGDHERDVFQRIYSLDGNYTERLSGKFLWHGPHLHYHFQDFAIYTLESMEASSTKPVRLNQKTTFCIRDSEPIDLSHPGANKSPSYTVCGKERQGVSPGWSDSYYYTFVDQKFDVTDLPKGQYKLKVVVNPLNRLEEITKDNNVGEVVFDLDVVNNKVKVISEKIYGI